MSGKNKNSKAKSKPDIYTCKPKVKVSIHQSVIDYFGAVSRQSDGDENLQVLYGTIDGDNLTIIEAISPPQKVSSGACDRLLGHENGLTNEEVTKIVAYNQKMEAYRKKMGWVVVGWSHFFGGGPHHSPKDHNDDANMSVQAKMRGQDYIVSITYGRESTIGEGPASIRVDLIMDTDVIDVTINNYPFTITNKRDEVGYWTCADCSKITGSEVYYVIVDGKAVCLLCTADRCDKCGNFLTADFTKPVEETDPICVVCSLEGHVEEMDKKLKNIIDEYVHPNYITTKTPYKPSYQYSKSHADFSQTSLLDGLDEVNYPLADSPTALADLIGGSSKGEGLRKKTLKKLEEMGIPKEEMEGGGWENLSDEELTEMVNIVVDDSKPSAKQSKTEEIPGYT